MQTTPDIQTVKTELAKAINADHQREADGIRYHNALREIIADKWTGKKVNKRICDQFRAKIGAPESAVIHLNYVGSMCYLEFWGKGISNAETFDKRIGLFLGYADTEFHGNGEDYKFKNSRSFNALTVEGFDENDACRAEPAQLRQRDRVKLLSNGNLDDIAEAVAQIKAATAKLKELTEYGNPGDQIKYTAERLAGLRKD